MQQNTNEKLETQSVEFERELQRCLGGNDNPVSTKMNSTLLRSERLVSKEKYK